MVDTYDNQEVDVSTHICYNIRIYLNRRVLNGYLLIIKFNYCINNYKLIKVGIKSLVIFKNHFINNWWLKNIYLCIHRWLCMYIYEGQARHLTFLIIPWNLQFIITFVNTYKYLWKVDGNVDFNNSFYCYFYICFRYL